MTHRIVRIEDAGPDRKARRLIFDDGSDERLTSAAAVKQLSLEAGSTVDRVALEDELLGAEGPLAKERALRLLGYRDRSSSELCKRLHDSGYSDQLAQSIVTRFTELGLVDDERFTAAWTRSRLASGVGPRRIQNELALKGVPAHMIAAAMAAECPDDTRLLLAKRALRGQVPADRKLRDRLIRRLVTRGYDLSTAIQAVSEAGDPGSQPDSP